MLFTKIQKEPRSVRALYGTGFERSRLRVTYRVGFRRERGGHRLINMTSMGISYNVSKWR